MKSTLNKLSLFFFILILLLIGCDKKEIQNNYTHETNPAKVIIGKWELIKVWDGSKIVNGKEVDIFRTVENPDWYEFHEDSVIKREIIYENELLTFSGKYWIDSLLSYNRELGMNPWYYKFSDDYNELMLQSAFEEFTGIKNIYKRIK
jgi:hypothetical protein